MEINLLYFEGCPSWQNALKNLQTVLRNEGLAMSINLIEVKSDQKATEMKFLGSPSFQINGEDFWPETRQSYSTNCRVYKTQEGLKGWPSTEMLREKLLKILKNKE
ncbi:MAG: DUF2703 domain-containing protein [Chloroflexi bacterium HGW-Chloroflexi-10]|nr:MAG: DUF2703 domain-containing protein [Chloroflexi bacterium HGW-Chloroflexi-10]